MGLYSNGLSLQNTSHSKELTTGVFLTLLAYKGLKVFGYEI